MIPETRGIDLKRGTTVRLREKEAEKDYRYMPEPDIPDVIINDVRFQIWCNNPIRPTSRKLGHAYQNHLTLFNNDF